MSITTMTNPGGVIDVEFYNGTASTILAGEVVMRDAAATAENFPVDRLYTGTRGPLEGLSVDMTQYAIKPLVRSTGDGDEAALGIALGDVLPNTWGKCRVYGPCLAKCVETADDGELTSYGAGTAAGQLKEVTASTSVHTVAFQIGSSGATSAGDKRKVFAVCFGSQTSLGGPWGTYA